MDDSGKDTALIFGIYDYLTLGFMLCISILIGLYSAFFQKENTVESYLFGNRKLKVLPVAASIMASEISSIFILTLPTEVYLYGSSMLYAPLGMLFSGVIIYFVVLPMLYNMRTNTIYEYLEKRFDICARTLCSFFFTLQTILTMPVLMCLTSLSLSLVTGFNFYIVTIVTGAVTTFYTAIGGIRAVVWADAFQTLFMFGGVIAVAVKGIMDSGSFTVVWNKNLEFDRLQPPDLKLDFSEMYNFWMWTIAGPLSWIVYGFLNQGVAQRYLSVPNLSLARLCLVGSMFFAIVFTSICFLIGMILVAEFGSCDPLHSHKILARDQQTSFFITKSLKNIAGLPGLIIAAISSATISTVSTQLNSVAAVVLNDYYKTFINMDVSEGRSSIVLKLTVVIFGIIITLVSLFVKVFGTAFQVNIIFSGAVFGSILGMFAVGFFLPMIKSKPAFLGGLAGFAAVVWIATGMNIEKMSGRLKAVTKLLSVEGCERNITITRSIHNNEDVFILYRIAPTWYLVIGMLVTVTVACLLSLFMERNDVRKMDYKLFSPLIHRWLPKQSTPPDTEMSLLEHRKETND